MTSFNDFVDYVSSFYLPNHADVLYPIQGATKERIREAAGFYLQVCAYPSNDISWGDGDSLDRERVRDYLCEMYDLEVN